MRRTAERGHILRQQNRWKQNAPGLFVEIQAVFAKEALKSTCVLERCYWTLLMHMLYGQLINVQFKTFS
jgi:hypothetical protein